MTGYVPGYLRCPNRHQSSQLPVLIMSIDHGLLNKDQLSCPKLSPATRESEVPMPDMLSHPWHISDCTWPEAVRYLKANITQLNGPTNHTYHIIHDGRQEHNLRTPRVHNMVSPTIVGRVQVDRDPINWSSSHWA